MEKKFDVFLSHNSQDKPWVIRLKNALVAYGIKVWLDKDEIRPGDLFVTALEKGITESKAVALIISPESIRSGWVNEEYHRALSLATHGQLQLIPVLYKDAEIPGFLGNRSWVDFRKENEYDESVRKLVWGITGEKPGTDFDGDPGSFLPNPLKKLDIYLRSIPPVLESLEKFLAISGALYEDQCKVVIEQINQLDSRIKLPPSYDVSTAIIGLRTQIKELETLLIDFSRTCPPGDRELRTILVDQIHTINRTLSGLSEGLPS